MMGSYIAHHLKDQVDTCTAGRQDAQEQRDAFLAACTPERLQALETTLQVFRDSEMWLNDGQWQALGDAESLLRDLRAAVGQSREGDA
jgi:hypothetical protein